MEVTKTRRIVLLGKTGSGKSSLANTIFGGNVFTISHTAFSETKEHRAETRSVNRRNITLIDTPGFFDTNMSEENLRTEIVRCITECAPGPHAFLIVLKMEKFTKQENDVIGKICEYFSEEAFKYAAVVFTHGNQLPEGMKIEQCVSQNNHVRDLVKKCGGRCHVVDNEYWNNNRPNEYRSNQFQVAELLNTIDKIVLKNNGGCYTNEMLQTVEREIQKEEDRIRLSSGNMTQEEIRQQAQSRVLENCYTNEMLKRVEEEIQQEEKRIRPMSENMSEQEIREQARVSVFKKLLIRLAGTATGVVLGALFGVVVLVGLVATVLKESSEPVPVKQAVAKTAKAAGVGIIAGIGGATVGGAVGGAVGATAGGASLCIIPGIFAGAGAVKGGLSGYVAAEGAETPWEAVERAAAAVKNEAKSCLDKANDAWDRLLQPELKQSQNQ